MFTKKLRPNGLVTRRIAAIALLMTVVSGCGSDKNEPDPQEVKPVVEVEQIEKEPVQLVSINAASNSANLNQVDAISPWLQLIHSHTTGQISRFHPITLKLNQALPKNAEGELIQFTPPISGFGQMMEDNVYRFTPTEPLPSGQKYEAQVLTKALGMPQFSEENYRFNFEVIAQAFELQLDGLKVGKEDEMSFSGKLITSDDVALDELSTFISAEHDGESLKAVWDEESKNPRSHAFTFKDIERFRSTSDFVISWDGQDIGVNKRGKKSFAVHAREDFDVFSIQTIQDGNQKIQVNFSQRLAVNQDLKGLIKLSSGKFRTATSGPTLTIYPSNKISGEVTVEIDAAIKSTDDTQMGAPVSKTLKFLNYKPSVKFIGKGNILPVSDKLSIPFEATNVNSVQVTAFQIFESNMPQFFQANDVNGNENLKRVGRYLWRKTVQLKEPVQDTKNRFNLDVRDLVLAHPGSLFRFELSINRSNSIYECSASDKNTPAAKESPFVNFDSLMEKEASSWDNYENYYGGNRYWGRRDNPCRDSYYQYASEAKDQKNFIASNVGLIAKQGKDGRFVVIASNLSSGDPIDGAEVKVVNFQNQVLGQAKTDENGFAAVALSASPYLVIVKKGNEIGYLKVSKALALSTSHYNVGGVNIEKGIKAELYTERGVWRPGDDIHLTVVVEDKINSIPDNHPVTLEFFNPRNQRVSVQVNSTPKGGFYAFTLKTAEDDMTGLWKAVANLGGLKFSKDINIEMVKPNHLKMKLDLKGDDIRVNKVNRGSSEGLLEGSFFAQWMHGAKASKLSADMSLQMNPVKTKFNTYSDFLFDDPINSFSGRSTKLASFNLDKDGNAEIKADVYIPSASPGKLSGTLTSRVFEPNGDFSISKQTLEIHPFQQYIGMLMPKGDAARGMLLTDKKHKVDLALVNPDGKLVLGEQSAQATLYKLNWKWWWDTSGDSLASYASRHHSKHILKEKIPLKDGLGQWEFEVKYPSWGRYLLRICDENGYHCTGKVFYMDWPGWAGRDQTQKGMGANVLTIATDKTKYEVGEVATITLPEANKGRALISIENGSQVIDNYWADLSQTGSRLQIPVTQAMTPNAYISVTIIQPHEFKGNDEPIRLMGITPITVTDPKTFLNPEIVVPSEVKPRSTMTVKVSEKDNKSFYYTLAIVDEGLLGLTQFRTPDLHRGFYKKEALGVKTWDLYDHVVGAYGASLEQFLAIGGDGDLGDKKRDDDNRRFPPVVKFMGPFLLPEGQSQTHEVEIPPYLGEVRVMLVAGNSGAYGKAEESVYVRQPLNLLTTLPRVLGQGESLKVPVTLFTTSDEIRDATVSVSTSDHISVLKKEHSVSFGQTQEKMVFVPIEANKLGKAKVTVVAKSGQHSATQTINIDVNPQTASEKRIKQTRLAPGETWAEKIDLFGIEGTQSVALEMSTMPPLNLQGRLSYLVNFPHGCVEQTTSKALPQLFLPTLTNLSDEQLEEIQGHVTAAIEKLRRYQNNSGGFSYWPSSDHVHDWASSYVGHFLLMAQEKGYHVPRNLLSGWEVNQNRMAKAWTGGQERNQAYRLYTLALSGKAELGAMNRLRQRQNMEAVTRWLLAAAYQLAGQQQAAMELIDGLSVEDSFDTSDNDDSFGSTLRDQSIVLLSLLELGETERAGLMAQKISTQLIEHDQYYSTQTTAFALMSMAIYAKYLPESEQSGIKVKWQSLIEPVVLEDAITVFPLGIDGDESDILLENTSALPIYVDVISEGTPKIFEDKSASNQLSIDVIHTRNTSREGNQLRVKKGDDYKQGDDYEVRVVVQNKSSGELKYLALTVPVASGFEIRSDSSEANLRKLYDFQDVRDDRIFTYFDLKKGEKKTFYYTVNATYQGRYYQSAVMVKDMYDDSISAKNAGHWIDIVR